MFLGILMSDALRFGMEAVRSLSDESVFLEPLCFVAESLLERSGCVAQLSFGLAVVESVVALEIVYREGGHLLQLSFPPDLSVGRT